MSDLPVDDPVDPWFAEAAGVVTTTDGIVHAAWGFVDGKKSPRCDMLDVPYVWQETGVITCIDCLAYDPDDWIKTESMPACRVNPRREYRWVFYEDKKKGDGDG